MTGKPTLSACLNCGAAVTGSFCAACGQKVRQPDPTLGEFLRESTIEVTNLDGRVPATFKTLFLNPGALTVDWLAGRRARWLTPLRVYLICSIAYFVSVPLVESLTGRQGRETVRLGFTVSGGAANDPATRAQLDSALADLDSTWIGRLIGRERIERIMKNPGGVQQLVSAAFPKAMFVLLPILALLTNVAFRSALPHFPAHLYLALHVNAAGFGALTLAKLTTLAGWIPLDVAAGLTAVVYIGWHALRSARVVFGGRWWVTTLKALAVAMVYLSCFTFATLILMTYAVSRIGAR